MRLGILVMAIIAVLMATSIASTSTSTSTPTDSMSHASAVSGSFPSNPWVAFSASGIAPVGCSGGGVYPYCVSISVYGDSLLWFEYVQPAYGLTPPCTGVQPASVRYETISGGMCQDLYAISIGYNSTAGTASFPYRLYYSTPYIGSWTAIDVPLAALDGTPAMSTEVTAPSYSWAISAQTSVPTTGSDLAVFFPSVYWTAGYPNDCPAISASSPSVLTVAAEASCPIVSSGPNRVETAVMTQSLTTESSAGLTASFLVAANFTPSSPYTSQGYVLLLERSIPTNLYPVVTFLQGPTTTTSYSLSWRLPSEPYYSLSYYLVGTTGLDINSQSYRSLNISYSNVTSRSGLIPSACYYEFALPVVVLTWFHLGTVLTGSNRTDSYDACTIPGAPSLAGQYHGTYDWVILSDPTIPLTLQPDYILSEGFRYGIALSTACSGVSYSDSGYLGFYSPSPPHTALLTGSLWPSYGSPLTLNVTSLNASDGYCFEASTYGAYEQGAWSSPLWLGSVQTGVSPPPPPSRVPPNGTFPSPVLFPPLIVLPLSSYQSSGGVYSATARWTDDLNASFAGEFALEATWLVDASNISLLVNGATSTPSYGFGIGDNILFIYPGSVHVAANASVVFVLTFSYTPPSPLAGQTYIGSNIFSLGQLYDMLAIAVVLLVGGMSLFAKKVGAVAVLGTILIFLTVGLELFG